MRDGVQVSEWIRAYLVYGCEGCKEGFGFEGGEVEWIGVVGRGRRSRGHHRASKLSSSCGPFDLGQ